MDDESTQPRQFTVVVTAGRVRDAGADSLERALDWQDAVVAVADAVLERGGRLVVPANPHLAVLLAVAAMPYARPHTAESSEQPARVQVFETGGHSETARAELAPLAHQRLLSYYDGDGRPVTLPRPASVDEHEQAWVSDEAAASMVQRELEEHHPLTRSMIEAGDLLGVVVVGNTVELDPELEMLAGERGRVPVAVLVSSETGEMGRWARMHDPAAEFEGGFDEASPAQVDPVPFALVAEEVIEGWLRNSD